MKFQMAATAGLSLTLNPMGKMFQNASSLKPLDEVRQNKLEQFKRTVEDIKGGGAELPEEKNQLLQAILDCTS